MGVQNWNRSPREAGESLPLEILKIWLHKAVSNPSLISPALRGRLGEVTSGDLFLAGDSVSGFQIYCVSLKFDVSSV